MPSMSDALPPGTPPAVLPPVLQTRRVRDEEEPVVCERCGRAEMYRMHAVWRCPACGFKTDCCGW